MSQNSQNPSELSVAASATAASAPGAGWTNGALPPAMFPYTRDGQLSRYSSQRRWIGLDSGAGWTRIGDGDPLDARHASSRRSAAGAATSDASPATLPYDPTAVSVRALIAQLCESFYRQNWATGTGGGVCIRVPKEPGDSNGSGADWRVFVAPSGIQKEDMVGDDIFELDMDRNVVQAPRTPGLKQSACTPLWYVVFRHRPAARSVIHTHSIAAQLATLLDPTECARVLRLTHLEMLKGVGGHAYDDVLEVPIIDNRPTEDLLADQLERAIQEFPKCNAVLVRRHGVYVWGDSWQQAKTQCESFDYLFQTALQMRQLGVDPGAMPKAGSYREDEASTAMEPAAKKAKLLENGFHGMGAVGNEADCRGNRIPLLPRDAKILLLDIEGCTTSIAFVKDMLFPYVTAHVEEYIKEHFNEQQSTDLAAALKEECQQAGLPATDSDAVALVRFMVEKDIKSAKLKNLQGDMWKVGYESGKLKSHVYSDFGPTLEWTKTKGIKVYIYSSGSIQAQQLLFGNSSAGDLLPFLSGHFDITTAGNKKEASSYTKIAATLQVDPSAIVFCSDAEAELVAARAAGIGWPVMSIRPGNAVLTPVGREFPAVYSLLQLCGEE